jgi:cytoskeletal protein CcmA (bactofilin family)
MTDPADQLTIIGPGARFKGDITFDGSGRILGTFEGTVRASGEVHVAHGALCHATIEAHTVVIDGRVEGDVIAHELLQLGNKASVKGDVAAGGLIVAKGASFNGRCDVGPEAITAAQERFATNGVDSMAEPKPDPRTEYRPEARPDLRTRKPATIVPEWVEQAATAAPSSDWLRPDGLPTVRVNPVVRPAANQFTA